MTRRWTLTLLAGLALAAAEAQAGPEGPGLTTSYTILVGFPLGEGDVSTGVLLVPGTVIPVAAGPGGDGA